MRLLRWLLLLVLLASAGAWFLAPVPFGPSQETFVDIPAGTGTAGIAFRLRHAGVIRSTLAFEVLRALRGGTLKAGEYRFDHAAPLTEVYARIARGDVYTVTVSIPEGFNRFDIAQAVEAAKLAPGSSFLAATERDANLVSDLAPGAPSLEGYLFPDTYRFSRHATSDQMVGTMVRRFRQVASTLGLHDSPATNHIVTLASLVEKEVSSPSERALVAGVFTNRLRLGIPLSTDPSVIYAALLDHSWRGTIYKSDLARDSPYNTYRHPGLPPTPICNPGVAALQAALSPAPTKYLYFEADASGGSRFSEDLKEHTQQVNEYRKQTAEPNSTHPTSNKVR